MSDLIGRLRAVVATSDADDNTKGFALHVISGLIEPFDAGFSAAAIGLVAGRIGETLIINACPGDDVLTARAILTKIGLK